MSEVMHAHAKREIRIQLSAPMVRAALDGTKTVTRRTVKSEIPNGAVSAIFERISPTSRQAWRWLDACGNRVGKPFRCPYGIAGDHLYSVEAWRTLGSLDNLAPRDVPAGSPLAFYADRVNASVGRGLGKFRPGMFMPRWASRILLEVIDVRIERLKNITREQAIAEGIERVGKRWRHYAFPTEDAESWEFPQNSFASLWESLNGEGAWESNPWIFAISFRRLTP